MSTKSNVYQVKCLRIHKNTVLRGCTLFGITNIFEIILYKNNVIMRGMGLEKDDMMTGQGRGSREHGGLKWPKKGWHDIVKQ